MIRRILAFALMVWLLGFLWFAVTLPGPAEDVSTDAIIVPTGGSGRIQRGIEVLGNNQAQAMLVTGVDTDVKPNEFAVEYDVASDLMTCCITLGFAAVDTRSNATEAEMWIADRGYESVRLVTSDWHMRRAANELARVLPDNITIIRDAVPTQPSFRMLFLEYNKLLASTVAGIFGG
ncbi:MAG: YdcF family protein [Sphingomonadaceae bacterium]